MTDGKANAHKLTELTVDIVSAYVSNNLCPDTMVAGQQVPVQVQGATRKVRLLAIDCAALT